MSKTEKVTIPTDPFALFSLLNGDPIPENMKPPKEDIVEAAEKVDDVIAGDDAIIEEEVEDTTIIPDPKDKVKPKKEKEVVEVIEEEVIEEQPEVVEDEDTAIKGFVSNLHEKGVIDFDITDEDFKPSEEGVETLIDKTVQNRINKWVGNLPEDIQKLHEFVAAGGTPKQFLEVYYGEHSWETFDIEDNEESQKTAVREALRLAGDTEEDIEDTVTEYYDNGTLEKRAKSALTKLQKHEVTQKEQIVATQKENDLKRAKAEKEQFEAYKKDLFSKEDLMGFKLTAKIKEKLWDYMTVPDRKTGKTGYQKALEDNKDSQLLFALQAMQGFDVGKLEKQVQTRVSNNFGKLLKNYTPDQKSKISSGSTQVHKDDNPFEAFLSAKL